MQIQSLAQYVRFDTKHVNSVDLSRAVTPKNGVEQFRLISMSGICICEDQFFASEFNDRHSKNLPMQKIIDGSGEWVAIGETAEGDQYLVLADTYGYAPLFYSYVQDQGLIASNNFQGVVAGLRDVGVEPELDLVNYFTLLGSSTPQFQNAYASTTMSLHVKILSPSNALIISKDSFKVVERSSLTDHMDKPCYDTLLRRGVSTSINMIKSLQPFHQNRRITLSGGVDSRLTLGLLKESGETKNFDVHTIDPRTWKSSSGIETLTNDINIANSIRENYALNWWGPGKRDAVSLSYAESLSTHQHFRSNYSFTFSPGSIHPMYKDSLLTIRGGGGELLRATDGGASMSKLVMAADVEQEAYVPWVARRMLKSSIIPDPYFDPSLQSLISSFDTCKGSNFEEQMNFFYYTYRNRAHFGHTRHTRSTNETLFLPLSNQFFLEAARMIDFEERKGGKVVRDIFAELDPFLLSLPFESKHWNKMLQAADYDSYDWNNTAWVQSIASRDRASINFINNWARGDRGEQFAFDPKKSGINFLREGFSVIEDCVKPDTRATVQKFHHDVLNFVYRGKFNPHHLVAKLASALDVFFPPSHSNGTFINGDLRSPLAPQVFYTSQNPCEFSELPYKEILELNPNIIKLDDGFRVEAKPTSCRKDDFVYAFYLLKNGKRIDYQWYSDCTSVDFIVPIDPGRYEAIAFARLKGKERYTFQDRTQYLHCE